MPPWIRLRRPRHTTIVAYLALFVALGGVSYAALKLPKDSIGAKQIKARAVRSSEVKNASLKAIDFAAGQLPAGAQGLKGDKGDKGDDGTPGTPGAPGTFGAVTTQFERAASDLPDN